MKKVFITIGIMIVINIVTAFVLANNYSEKIMAYETLNQTVDSTEIETELKKEIEALKTSLTNEVDVLKTEIKELEESNESLNTEIDILNEQKQKDANTITSLKQQITTLQNENKSLKEKSETITKDQKVEPTPTPKPEVTPTPTPEPKKEKKVAYLTFDDGPSQNTLKILDILDKNNIKATFFATGGTSDFYKSTIADIANRGHAIGNHTYSHDYKNIYSSIDGFYKDLAKNEDNLYSIIGYRPEIIRFPGGSNNHVSHQYGGTTIMKQIIDDLDKEKYQYFDWNVSSTDAEVSTQDTDKIINSVINGAKNKNNIIVLFHDSKPKTTTAEALPTIIKELQKMGFEFETLKKDSYTVQFEK